jgi:ribonuclease VapC
MANDLSNVGYYVLDTSALLTLHQDEQGADEVEKVLSNSANKHSVWISFISLMEFSYILQQQAGIEEARQSYAKLKQLPLMVMDNDEELGLIAASLKASYQVSLADAWIAATAQRLDAMLMHKDPEFEHLSKIIKLHSLPYKSNKRVAAL